MKKVKRYEFDGEAIEVPVCWDRHLRRYVEDCTAYCEQPGYTPAGRPVLLTFEDACPQADLEEGGVDCGACRHFRPVPGTLLGVCQNEKRNKKRRGRRSGQSTKTKEEMK